MKVIITGGLGFLGQALCSKLLADQNLNVKKVVLVDIVDTHNITDDRVSVLKIDLSKDLINSKLAEEVKTANAIFHLAAIVSSHAESDPDLGYEINFVATKNLLDLSRSLNPSIRFIFSSSLAVFGGKLPQIIEENTALTPQSTYGTQKAMCELLINDYARRGFVDAISVRLPTICIRPGVPNKAASSFVSGIIREPLKGVASNCPVNPDLELWISSPDVVIANFIKALTIQKLDAKEWHTINLPGIKVSVKQMLDTLKQVKGDEILNLISYEYDASIDAIVASWPSEINNARSTQLGFIQDDNFNAIIHQFISKK